MCFENTITFNNAITLNQTCIWTKYDIHIMWIGVIITIYYIKLCICAFQGCGIAYKYLLLLLLSNIYLIINK